MGWAGRPTPMQPVQGCLLLFYNRHSRFLQIPPSPHDNPCLLKSALPPSKLIRFYDVNPLCWRMEKKPSIESRADLITALIFQADINTNDVTHPRSRLASVEEHAAGPLLDSNRANGAPRGLTFPKRTGRRRRKAQQDQARCTLEAPPLAPLVSTAGQPGLLACVQSEAVQVLLLSKAAQPDNNADG